MELNVSEPWFSHIAAGRKTVEGRLKKGKFATLQIDDVIVINDTLKATVKAIRHYATFHEYLTAEGLDRCLPTVETIAEGCAVYYQFYTPQMEKELGVMAIEIAV